jgi:hypothetical protein
VEAVEVEAVVVETQGQPLKAEGEAGFPSEGRIPAEVVAVAHQPGEKVQCGSRIPREAAAVRSRRIQRIWIGPESAAALWRLQVDGPRSPSATSRPDRRARRCCEQAHSENSLPPPTWWPELWGTALHQETYVGRPPRRVLWSSWASPRCAQRRPQ